MIDSAARTPRAILGASTLALICGSVITSSLHAAETTLDPSKDNTLYESPEGIFSNGEGEFMFLGNNNSPEIRRAILAFDLSSIPAYSTVTSVDLQVYMSQTISGPQDATLHRTSQDWGESTSHANGGQGGGSFRAIGDVTWIHTFADDQFWNNPGGDFEAAASGQTVIAGPAFYTFNSTPAMVSDVQGWIDDGETNFGWVIRGNESAQATAKRLATREHPDAARRPKLTIEYIIGGDLDGNDAVNVDDMLTLLSEWGPCGKKDCVSDINGDNVVDVNDLLALLANWTG